MKDKVTKEDLNENCPILMQKDFQTTIKNIADLPDYLRKINENIMNIDKKISKKELCTEKVKQLNSQCSFKENKVKCSNDLIELNNLVKQSVEGLHDILGVKKDSKIIETIEEENFIKHQHGKNQSIKQKEKNFNLGSPDNKKNVKKAILNSSNKKSGKGETIKINKANSIIQTHKCSNGASAIQRGKLNKTNDTNEIMLHNNNSQLINLVNEQSQFNVSSHTGMNPMSDSKNNDTNFGGNNTSVHSKERKTSKSPQSSNNNFRFKPRTKKNSMSDVSILSETVNKNVVAGFQKANTFKPTQYNQKFISHPQRLLTEQNKSSSNKHTTTSLIQQDKITITKKNQNHHLYSKNEPKSGMTQDILRLMLFFNEYILSTSTIKASENNKETLETVSLALCKAIKGIEEDFKNNKSIDISSIDRVDLFIPNDKLCESVLKLQRKWRRYKIRDIIVNNSDPNGNESNLIKNMIVTNFMDKEGFGAKNLIGMINSSIESFLQLKTNKIATKQLSNITLNNMSIEERYMLYKKYINYSLGNQSNFNQTNSTLRNSKIEHNISAILQKTNTSQTKTK